MKPTPIAFFLICSFSFAFSQNEIDKLAQTYENDTITIYTSSGNLTGISSVLRNADNKPYSVIIEGIGENREQVAEFFLNLFKQKISEGYKLSKNSILEYNLNKGFIASQILAEPKYEIFGPGIDEELTKGNYVFKAKASASKTSPKVIRSQGQYGLNERIDFNSIEIIIEYKIEMIDLTRLGGSNAKTFKF